MFWKNHDAYGGAARNGYKKTVATTRTERPGDL